MGELLRLGEPWWALVARVTLVYAFLLVILRITGKRQVGQLAPFDLVLLLVLSNSVQNAMMGADSSVSGGFLAAATLILLNSLVSMATYRSKRLEGLIEGRPQLLIHNGQLDERVMREARLTHHELMAALRQAGHTSVGQVHTAILENNGTISVTGRNNHETGTDPASPPVA
jgi:uncharacterized membrane protein YcaP (DUF421 family)